MHPLLLLAAERAALDPAFLGHLLGPDLPAACRRLGVTPHQAYTLYLCRMPTTCGGVRACCAAAGVTGEGCERVVRAWEGRG